MTDEVLQYLDQPEKPDSDRLQDAVGQSEGPGGAPKGGLDGAPESWSNKRPRSAVDEG